MSNQQAHATRPRLVAVLGMHRSGTSAIAAALRVMGVELGNNLMPARAGVNDRGFFEDMDIYQFNEELLAQLGASWHSLDPTLEERLRAGEATSMQQRAATLLKGKLANTDLFGMKDPRLPRVLPFWQSVFDELGLSASYVIALRNPLSVAASLQRHHGVASTKGLLLWLQHSLAAIDSSQHARRVVLQYERLLADPEGQLKRVARRLGLMDRLDRAALTEFSREFLDVSLCHTRFGAEELRQHPDVQRTVADTFELLQRIAIDELDLESSEAIQALRQIESEFASLHPLLALVSTAEHSAAAATSKLTACEQALAAANWPSGEQLATASQLMQQLQDCEGRQRGDLNGVLGDIAVRASVIADAARLIAAAADRVEAVQARQAQANEDAAQRLEDCRAESACLQQTLQACEARQQELRDHLAEMTARSQDLAQAAAERDAILASTIWRITGPLRRIIGAVRGQTDLSTTPAAVPAEGATGVAETAGATGAGAVTASSPEVGVEQVVADALPDLGAIPTYPDPSPRKRGRITLLTDTLGATSLFGGVATAIILAVLLAQHRGMRLRVVTRHSPPEPANLGTILAAHGLDYQDNIEFEQAPLQLDSRALATSDDELILTTSWWTTWAARRSFDPARIYYLVQEDERMFYPAGDLRLRCQEILCDERLRFIVNTTALREHFIAEGMAGIGAATPAFEPAFPTSIYYPERGPERGRPQACRTFFFYARPHHPRNLFLRGLEAVAAAVETGLFAPSTWEFHFLGRGLPPVKLPREVRPRLTETLSWKEYAALIRRVDVGLSLQYTPHPSYPPFDLAACGAVVVTNQQPARPPLSRYCDNILCVEPALDDLVHGLTAAVTLAQDDARRQQNHRSARIERDWQTAMAPVLGALAEG